MYIRSIIPREWNAPTDATRSPSPTPDTTKDDNKDKKAYSKRCGIYLEDVYGIVVITKFPFKLNVAKNKLTCGTKILRVGDINCVGMSPTQVAKLLDNLYDEQLIARRLPCGKYERVNLEPRYKFNINHLVPQDRKGSYLKAVIFGLAY